MAKVTEAAQTGTNPKYQQIIDRLKRGGLEIHSAYKKLGKFYSLKSPILENLNLDQAGKKELTILLRLHLEEILQATKPSETEDLDDRKRFIEQTIIDWNTYLGSIVYISGIEIRKTEQKYNPNERTEA